ncbi:MAG: tyrosine-type recombinase/integrase [Spirochaetales bacterium]|nr:tyrosine-type recombinase/integrase [Spirochaetales bacterium]
MNELEERIQAYLTYLEAIKNMSPETIRNYRADLSRYVDYAKSAECGFVPDLKQVRGFLTSLSRESLKESTINRIFSCVRGFYHHLYRDQVIDHNPFDLVKALKIPRRLPNYLFPRELSDYLDIEGDGLVAARDRALLGFFYSTGCRVSEVSGLTLDAMNLSRGTSRVLGKGDKERIVFLGKEVQAHLREYLPRRDLLVKGNHSFVFVSQSGRPLSNRGIRYIIDEYSKKIGMQKNVSPHTFRHTFATHLVEEGADIRIVQEMLGHSSISTTGVYTHGNLDRLRGVYESAHPHSRRK